MKNCPICKICGPNTKWEDHADLTNPLVKYPGAEFDPASNKLFVVNSRLACKLNEILKQYDDGNYYFAPGEEVVFKVPSNQLRFTLETVEKFLVP